MTTHKPTDDLVKQADAFRLGSRPTDADVDKSNWLIDRMSARIEELEAERDVVAKLLAEAVEALRGWIDFAELEGMAVLPSDLEAAGLKGQDDE